MRLRGQPELGATQPLLVHIKVLKEQKKPRSANEMAALVAYFLANTAPAAERKNRITTKDIKMISKSQSFRLRR